MPELPEVETVRRGLEPVLLGRRFARVTARRPDLRWPLPERLGERLAGRRVRALVRRAKYLLAALDGGETLLLHLGMSGRLTVAAPALAPASLGVFHHVQPQSGCGLGPHDHVVFEMEGGARIVFTDHRRFGALLLVADADLSHHPLLAPLGPEPLSEAFDADALSAALAGRRTPVKAALLDQRVVAGLGNIYVCEALHRARISPRRLASSVAGARAARLVSAIKAVLAEAIAAGGSSLRDYAAADGALGYFQTRFRVYDRDGEACPSPGCRGTVARILQSGRSSFFCARCQR